MFGVVPLKWTEVSWCDIATDQSLAADSGGRRDIFCWQVKTAATEAAAGTNTVFNDVSGHEFDCTCCCSFWTYYGLSRLITLLHSNLSFLHSCGSSRHSSHSCFQETAFLFDLSKCWDKRDNRYSEAMARAKTRESSRQRSKSQRKKLTKLPLALTWEEGLFLKSTMRVDATLDSSHNKSNIDDVIADGTVSEKPIDSNTFLTSAYPASLCYNVSAALDSPSTAYDR